MRRAVSPMLFAAIGATLGAVAPPVLDHYMMVTDPSPRDGFYLSGTELMLWFQAGGAAIGALVGLAGVRIFRAGRKSGGVDP